MHKVLFWTGFGLAVRFWQLGIEMRPIWTRDALWPLPIYGGVGASFGYWMMGVEQRHLALLNSRRESLLEKRRRRAERQGLDPASVVEPANSASVAS